MKLREFAEIVNGTIFGNPDIEIAGVAGIKDAKEGDITFISSPKYLKDMLSSGASCFIVRDPVEGTDISQLKVGNPYYAFAKAIEVFYPKPHYHPHISKSAHVSDKAVIGKNVAVFPFSYIAENVTIGDDTVIMAGAFVGANTKIGRQCTIYPNVVIRENITIGSRVIIHAGTVIGSDGYGYTYENGEHYKIPQVGNVIIEDNVEIGSNVSVDRATLGSTVIGKGTKIDNLVQIAHNVRIGKNSLIVSQVAIGGSSDIGDGVVIGGQSAIADHTTIEAGTMIAGQSGVVGQVEKGVYSGTPAIPHKNWLRSQALFAKLPEIYRRLRELEEKLKELEKGEE